MSWCSGIRNFKMALNLWLNGIWEPEAGRPYWQVICCIFLVWINQWIFKFPRSTLQIDKWDAELLKCHITVMCTISWFILVFEWRCGEWEIGPNMCNSCSINKKCFHFGSSLDVDSKIMAIESHLYTCHFAKQKLDYFRLTSHLVQISS